MVHATKKLLDRVKQRPQPEAAAATSMFGSWYATYVGWRPQVVLFVNERTLLPVLMPLAPAARLLERFPQHLAGVLGALDVPSEFVDQELEAMGEGVWTKTANRSVVGSMNEFVLLAEAWRDRGRADDLLAMSLHLAGVPCSPLDRSEGFPDREVAALVERWRCGEVAPLQSSIAPTSPEASDAQTAARPEPSTVRNRRPSDELTELDVESALDRIASRNEERAREAHHVYDALTWGEGPEQLSQARLQHWLWYELATKYLTDEPGFMTRLVGIAAELFDELALDGYAAVCRSRATVEVHAAFDRSSDDGQAAMRRALDASGIEPPDTDSFRWGNVMGIEESMARTAAELALERAIDTGDLVVRGRGWGSRQRDITDAVLDSDHPSQSGQTWRTTITTERIGSWIDEAARRSDEFGRLRSRIGNRLLHPIDPPPDVAERLAPITWLLQRFGSEQHLTQAGYLNRTFVLAVHAERPWEDPFDTGRPPHTETDEITLHRLRDFLERAGALRRRGRVLQRTKRGTAMAVDPSTVWKAVVEHIGANPWGRFVTETYGLLLIERSDSGAEKELTRTVVALAGDAGWRIGGAGGGRPTDRDVSWAFNGSRALMGLCGLLDEDGDWTARHYRLTAAGETLMLTMLRASAAGPRDHP